MNKYKFKLNTAEVNDSHMGLARRIRAGERILELGCSSGYLSRFLKQDLGCYVVGVDINRDAIREAAAFCDRVIVADLDESTWLEKITKDKFDTILCADVLEHLKNPAALLQSLKPYLSPKGRVLASIPNVAHASVRLELLSGHFDYESLGLLDDTHLHFYTLDGCVLMFMQAGYLCSDVAYSIHDLADEVIDEYLGQAGLKISAEGRRQLHAPEASAFQFIFEAFPAAEALLKHKPPVLSPKPLVTSGAFYSHKQERIEELERQLKLIEHEQTLLKNENAALQVHVKNHLKNIDELNQKLVAKEAMLEGERVHNQNHLKNIKALETTVAELEREVHAERIHNKNHQINITAFEFTVKALERERDAEKVHNQNHLLNIQAYEQRVTALTEQKAAELEHNLNHQKHIQALGAKIAVLEQQLVVVSQACDAEKVHNQNHLRTIAEWGATTRFLDERLFDYALHIEGLNAEREVMAGSIGQAHAEVQAFRAHAEHLQAEVNRLEGVLQRVHRKASYRAMRFIKNAPKAVAGTFRKTDVKLSVAPEITPAPGNAINVHDYSAWLALYGDISQDLLHYQSVFKTWVQCPKIAILMPTYNTTKACLEAAIESVLAQVYPNWELCIADDASPDKQVIEIIKRYAAVDCRIKTLFRTDNGHISIASNSALTLVSADYVALMDHDDVLTPDAMYWVAKTIVDHPDVQLIYSDEDKLNGNGERYGPYFKPDWNPELIMSHNFICHLGVYKTERLRTLGGFDPAFDGAQDYNLALRYSVDLEDKQIQHIPRILYHWRATPGSTANGIHEKPYAEPLIRRAVEQALADKGVAGEVIPHAVLPGALRVRYALPANLPLVSIIIPTRNGFSLLKRCVESILAKTDYQNFELIIIDNGSDEWVAQRYLNYLSADERITVLRDDSPFNYAALNNKAVEVAKGDFIAFLNNDLEVINTDWLNEMMGFALQSKVGAVGAKLYYPSDLIQHAGVIVGLGGVAGHSHKHFPRDNPGYCGRLLLAQNLSAVTAACLVVKKAIFEEVKGFDSVNLSVAFNDVDLCLRIQEAGYRNIWTPYAELYHYESATRGYEDTPEKQTRFTREVDYMKQRWGGALLEDPAYNPNLTLDREDFSFAFPPRA